MKLLYSLALFALALTANAEVTLPKVFSSHMVLQRDMPIHIWGDAAPGEQVTVDLHGTTNTATTDNLGRWSLRLPAQSAGGPFALTIHGTNTVQLDDILIGDLWIASGQSNMEMPLAGFPGSAVVKDADKEIAAANYPQIRLLLVEKDVSDYPLEDVKAATGWSLCTPETAKNFSAVAFFFALALQQKEHVPIGLVDTTWGGTPAEAWTSLDALGADASLMPVFSARAEKMDRETTEQRADIADKQAKAEGKPGIHGREWHPNPDSWRPAALYNAMIAPFTPLPIRGVIWYQGETNSSLNRAPLYSRLFPAMIQDWRNQWRQGSFPFLFAQISAFDSPEENWGLLRDAQRRTLHLVDTGMAVTLDIGSEHNVHPSDKQTVGQRLSLLARNIAYGENLVASGPLFRLAYPDHGAMHVWFNNATGLKAEGAVQGFEVAGADGKFVPATAKIEGDTIITSSPTIPDPRYVRYAWSNFPAANLLNGAGLPTSTFTSYPVP